VERTRRRHREYPSCEPPTGNAARRRRTDRRIIDRLDADAIGETDELHTLVAMLRGSVFQMLNDAGATEG
jgi:hypothetical protein